MEAAAPEAAVCIGRYKYLCPEDRYGRADGTRAQPGFALAK